MHKIGNLSHVDNGASDVACLGARDEAGPRRKKLSEVVDLGAAGSRVDLPDADDGAMELGHTAPASNVGLVVKVRHDDLGAGLKRGSHGARKVLGDHGRRMAGHDLVRRGSVHEEGSGAQTLVDAGSGTQTRVVRRAELNIRVEEVGLEALHDQIDRLGSAGIVEQDLSKGVRSRPPKAKKEKENVHIRPWLQRQARGTSLSPLAGQAAHPATFPFRGWATRHDRKESAHWKKRKKRHMALMTINSSVDHCHFPVFSTNHHAFAYRPAAGPFVCFRDRITQKGNLLGWSVLEAPGKQRSPQQEQIPLRAHQQKRLCCRSCRTRVLCARRVFSLLFNRRCYR